MVKVTAQAVRSVGDLQVYGWQCQVHMANTGQEGEGRGGGGANTICIYRRGAGSSLLGDSHNGKSNSTSRQVSW